MDISEIISDALIYPLHNIKASVIYIVLGIIAGLAAGGTLVGTVAGTAEESLFGMGGFAIAGLIVFFVISLLISGYTLDIVKYGIQRRADCPGIELKRQIANAIKLIAIGIVYYIIPAIICFIIGFIFQEWLYSIIAFVIYLLFTMAELMAKCRLAKTDKLTEALSIPETIADISRVGVIKLVLTVILIALIVAVAFIIISFINQYNSTIGGILFGIFFVYEVFFYNRAVGLLYSNVF